jgi:hypothetical protein
MAAWGLIARIRRSLAALRVQIACATGDVDSLWAINTCFASAFAALRVQIACAISRTGGAGLADNSCQTKNPASLQRRGFVVWYQWPESHYGIKLLFYMVFMLY